VVWSHCGGRYADIKFAHDPRLETAVEVHSSWGTFEWLLHDALEMNYRVGVVCNSDGHKGRVGASYPGASFFGAYGGLTCYLSPELTREAIFETLRRRRHYGTTGARIHVDLRVRPDAPCELFLRDPDAFDDAQSETASELLMGDIARVSGDEVELHIDVAGSAPIERIDIFDGLDHLATHRPYGDADLGACLRLTWSGAEYRGRARTTTWDGALNLTGNAIARAEMFNNWNLDRGIQTQTADGLTWKAVTSGNYGGLDLWLTKNTAGRIAIETKHKTIEANIADLGTEALTYQAGGLDRNLTLQRLPDTLTHQHLTHTLRCRLRKTGDTRIYVRVQQIDGHRAWTSPVYLFR
jgi:hypothetical protein